MITVKDFYLVRTPLLPLNFLDQFNDVPFAQLPLLLKNIFTAPYLQEAIYIASPELYQELQKWLEGGIPPGKDEQKLVLALFRYLLRMSTRCTPYGLFAGCATGRPGPATHIELDRPELHKKHCRLDMNYVAELSTMLTRLPELQAQLLYYPNNSLYKVADTYRYASFIIKNKYRQYDLTSVDATDYLEKILDTAQQGAHIHTLAQCVTGNGITAEEAGEFILELIDSQVLVSELEPSVTGEEFFTRLITKLGALQNAQPFAQKLSQIQGLLQDQAASVDKYLQTHALVKSLLPDTNSKDLVQTDLFLATRSNTISTALISDIQQQVTKLWCLSRLNNNADLQNFCRAFRERYEEQEVPLAVALDAEAGIGYAEHSGSQADHTPLIDDIHTGNGKGPQTVHWDKMQAFQLNRLYACLRDNSREMVLTDEDLETLKETDNPVIPDSLYMMGSILGPSAAAIDEGNYQFELGTCSGPSSANLLARFCHGDEQLTQHVIACLREEEQYQPDVIYAELVHLPEARTGNILLRPQLRDYEIVYLGNGGVPLERQIPLTDLMVSVQHNTVILRSKKLNKRVIPRLSTAHNFRNGSLPAYRFLCDLQFHQLYTGIVWRWDIVKDEPFLPRVRYGKIILSKATWTLHKKDYPALNADQPGLLREIREKLQLPRYVVIVEGDNELLIDMENETCLRILARNLLKKEVTVLQEFLNTAPNCWITGHNGVYTNEVIIPFKRDAKPAGHASRNGAHTAQTPVRRFITGSEWLYVKLYCGTSSAERVLKSVIKPLVNTLQQEGLIDQWFFIRYADPEHHIRVRFHHAARNGFWKEVLEKLYAALQEDIGQELVYRVQTDTYIREIERYGAATMELSEALFCHDSEAVINFIDLLEGEEGETYRWLLAARGTDMLLQDFGYDLPAKAALIKQMQEGYFREFDGDKSLLLQLNDKYREHMRQLGSFLDPRRDAENEIEEAIALFTLRSLKLAPLAEQIRALASTGELLPSYIHMFLNRILLSNQRKHELVIYHFLSRYYESQIAIHKKQLQKSR